MPKEKACKDRAPSLAGPKGKKKRFNREKRSTSASVTQNPHPVDAGIGTPQRRQIETICGDDPARSRLLPDSFGQQNAGATAPA
jgi:hypothetical protein